MKTYGKGGGGLEDPRFLDLALVRNELSASSPCRFTLWEKASSTYWIGGWVDQSRAERHGKVKILDPTGTQNPTPRYSSP
jgi:hypothetical protein